MTLLSYTSYAEVRAVLGVSTTELPDSVLAQPQWFSLLILDLEDVNVGIPALFDTVSALPSKTAQQQRFVDLSKLYASYSLAKLLLTSLPMFSVQSLTDGRAEFARASDILDDVRDGIAAAYNTMRLRLTTAYVQLDVGVAAYGSKSHDFTVSTGLALNPVTNT